MRALYLTLLFFTCCCTSVSAQKTYSSQDPAYIENVTLGEEKLNAGDYGSCLQYYAKAFEIKQTSFLSIMRAAACAYSAENAALRDQYLDLAFSLHPDGATSVSKYNEEFEYLRETTFADLVHQRFLAAYPDFDQALADTLLSVRNSDQAQRVQMRRVSEENGSQVGNDPETGEFYFFTIAQPYKVDSLRETIGLPPLIGVRQKMGFYVRPGKAYCSGEKEGLTFD